VAEETKEKQCIHIALGSRQPGRSIINKRSINIAHSVNAVLFLKAVDTCNELFIFTQYFCRERLRARNALNHPSQLYDQQSSSLSLYFFHSERKIII